MNEMNEMNKVNKMVSYIVSVIHLMSMLYLNIDNLTLYYFRSSLYWCSSSMNNVYVVWSINK